MKDIRNYLQFHLGCEVQTPKGIERLVSVGLLGSEEQQVRTLESGMSFTNGYKFSEIKPILRKLPSMTKDEWEEMFDLPGMSIGERSKDSWLKRFDQFEQRPKPGFGKKWQEKNPGVEVPTISVKVVAGLNWEFYTYSPSAFIFLLYNGFDLFGLIDSGLAIDKLSTIKEG